MFVGTANVILSDSLIRFMSCRKVSSAFTLAPNSSKPSNCSPFIVATFSCLPLPTNILSMASSCRRSCSLRATYSSLFRRMKLPSARRSRSNSSAIFNFSLSPMLISPSSSNHCPAPLIFRRSLSGVIMGRTTRILTPCGHSTKLCS